MTGGQGSSATPWPFEDLVDRYELAYRASEDALRDQRDRIDEMRGRAITLLSVAVGVLAFLGERIFDHGASRRLDTGWGPFNSHAAVAVSVASFLVVVASAVWVWWPVKGSFTLSGKGPRKNYLSTSGGRERCGAALTDVGEDRVVPSQALSLVTSASSSLSTSGQLCRRSRGSRFTRSRRRKSSGRSRGSRS